MYNLVQYIQTKKNEIKKQGNGEIKTQTQVITLKIAKKANKNEI